MEKGQRYLDLKADANRTFGARRAIADADGDIPAGVQTWTPLLALAMSHHKTNPKKRVKFADALLKAGAKIDAEDQFGRTALFGAVKNNLEELAGFLLSKGAATNVRTKNGHALDSGITPLHLAVEHPSILKLFVKAKANLNIQDDAGNTPLHYACMDGNEASVQILAEAGADVDLANNIGTLPIYWVEGRTTETEKRINQLIRRRGI